MKIRYLIPIDVLARLQSNQGVLLAGEASRRFFKCFTHLFVVFLSPITALDFLSGAHEQRQGMLVLGFALVGAIVFNGAFSFWREYRSDHTSDALQLLSPQQESPQRNGQQRRCGLGLDRQV